MQPSWTIVLPITAPTSAAVRSWQTWTLGSAAAGASPLGTACGVVWGLAAAWGNPPPGVGDAFWQAAAARTTRAARVRARARCVEMSFHQGLLVGRSEAG